MRHKGDITKALQGGMVTLSEINETKKDVLLSILKTDGTVPYKVENTLEVECEIFPDTK